MDLFRDMQELVKLVSHIQNDVGLYNIETAGRSITISVIEPNQYKHAFIQNTSDTVISPQITSGLQLEKEGIEFAFQLYGFVIYFKRL